MTWERFIDMAQWPYRLQEVFKALTVVFLLLACLWLWRRRPDNLLRSSPGSISYVVCLTLVTGMEIAGAVLRLWPYVFGWPHNPMLLRRIYEAGLLLSMLAICFGVGGLFGRERERWIVLGLALLLFFQWAIFVSGEPGMIVS